MAKRKLAELLSEVYGRKGEVIDLYEWALREYARFPKIKKVKCDYRDIYKMYQTGSEDMKRLSNTEEHLWIH